MKHARKDYNRFQDPENKIPEDEPVFLLRAQDKYSAQVVDYYAKLLAEDNEVDLKFINLCANWSLEMEKWPKKKTPDMPNN